MIRWTYWEAVHIFPLEREDRWTEHGYSQRVTNMGDTAGNSKINSCQNGFLLRLDVQSAFDQYLFSVNPDVGSALVFLDLVKF